MAMKKENIKVKGRNSPAVMYNFPISQSPATFLFPDTLCLPIRLWPIHYVCRQVLSADTFCPPIRFVSNFFGPDTFCLPIRFVVDTFCCLYVLSPIRFVADTLWVDTFFPGTFCPDTFCSCIVNEAGGLFVRRYQTYV